MVAQVAQLTDRTKAKIAAREQQVRGSIVGQTAAVPTGNGVAVPNGIAPDMRAKLEALHAKYQRDFNSDANRTIAQFQKTRADLSRRFAQLASVDSAAQSGAHQQMTALQKQRGDLYAEMVAQIGREVKVIAQRRGISVVVGDVVAPANGVDLTGDATKDIESLHE
jgi:Skp family chaperone for outer membrane proteins